MGVRMWVTIAAAAFLGPRGAVAEEPKPRSIQVTVLGTDDKPLAGAEIHVSVESWRGNKALYNHKHPNVLDTKIPRQANDEGLFEWTWAPDDAVSYTFYKDGFRAVRGKSLIADHGLFAVRLER